MRNIPLICVIACSTIYAADRGESSSAPIKVPAAYKIVDPFEDAQATLEQAQAFHKQQAQLQEQELKRSGYKKTPVTNAQALAPASRASSPGIAATRAPSPNKQIEPTAPSVTTKNLKND